MAGLEKVTIPILKTGEFPITSPQVALHGRLAVKYEDEIFERIVETKAKELVLWFDGMTFTVQGSVERNMFSKIKQFCDEMIKLSGRPIVYSIYGGLRCKT